MGAQKRATLEQAETAARNMARRLKGELPEGWGFVVVLANYGEATEEGLKTFLSTVQRADAVKLLREMADAIESREESL